MAVVTLAEAQPPNVVLIMADDLSHYSVSEYGSKSYQTPHLDQLAKTGMRFNQAYALPLCTPTRVALMTGMHNGVNYLGGHSLELSQVTFGELFKDAGYATCFAGKWKLGVYGSTPADFGFDEYAVTEYALSHPRYRNPTMHINGKLVKHTDGEYGPDIANRFALDFIEECKDKPFFLYYPMILVHDPHTPPPDRPGYEANKEDNANFPEMVRYMDSLVGRVVTKLDELGLRENTLVLFTGDNGNKKVHTITLNDGSKYGGGKGLLSDEGVHVPLIANQKGVVHEGINDDLIDLTDVLPTICAYAGIAIPPAVPVTGVSFSNRMLGKPGDTVRDSIYHWFQNTPKDKLEECAFDTKYRLYATGKFYHVPSDMKEKAPLADAQLSAEQKQVKARLQAVLDDHRPVVVSTLAAKEQTVTLTVGEKRQLEVAVLPEDATKNTLSWTSSKESVAHVNKWGRVEARAKGTAVINVLSVGDAVETTIQVSVR